MPNKKQGEECQERGSGLEMRENTLREAGEKKFLDAANGSADRVVTVGNGIPAQLSLRFYYSFQSSASERHR